MFNKRSTMLVNTLKVYFKKVKSVMSVDFYREDNSRQILNIHIHVLLLSNITADKVNLIIPILHTFTKLMILK